MDIGATLRLLGLIQGTIIAVLTIARKRGTDSWALGTLLALLTIHLAVMPLAGLEGMIARPWVLPVFGALPYLYGPLFFVYARAVVYRPPYPRMVVWPHLAPWILTIVINTVAVVFSPPGAFEAVVRETFAGNPAWWTRAIEAGMAVSGLVYTGIVVAILWRNRRALGRWVAASMLRRLLTVLAAAFVVSWIVVAMSVTSPDFGYDVAGGESAGRAIITWTLFGTIFLVSVLSLVEPRILTLQENREKARERLKMAPDAVAALADRLDAYLEDGAFRDSELSLSAAARDLGVHANRLSFAVNDHHNMSFKQRVNSYRLEDFVRRAQFGDLATVTILALAMDVGFSSKATFNRAFMAKFGTTPREYLAK